MNQLLMNNKSGLVDLALKGMLRAGPFNHLVKLGDNEGIRIIVRRDWDKGKVALISGGGSGHEPAHVGFVGKGMLTAAVCGDVFTSPSVDAVLSAIINVTGEAGCLLIVKNYTGDRLNFGLAAEKARKMGYRVELIIVRDDISLPDNPQPRGIAGTALIHKITGYLAEQGHSLDEVMEAGRQAISQTRSLGVAFSGCNIPGESHDDRVKKNTCELGIGIHGEPGAEILHQQNVRMLAHVLVQKLLLNMDKQKPVALMINNLGGLSSFEMSLITEEVFSTPLAQSIKVLIGPATVVSALDMKGFSLSVLTLNESFHQALFAPVMVAGWPAVITPCEPDVMSVENKLHEHNFTPSENAYAAAIVSIVCETLIEAEGELNRLDALVGDGDTGSTFAGGARRVLDALHKEQLPLNEVEDLMVAIGELLATAMGGSSGVLMSIMFNAAGQKCGQGSSLASSLAYGLRRMQYYGGAGVGDRTMIDAMEPAFATLSSGKSLDEVAKAAAEGANSTCSMQQAKAGRSSYLNSDNLNGVKDPGARAVERVFDALNKYLYKKWPTQNP